MSAYTIINAAYAASLFGFAAVIWRVTRPRPTVPTEDVPAADDNEPGTDTAAADECALIYSLPALDPAWEAGRERLWDAIRDEQTNTTEGD